MFSGGNHSLHGCGVQVKYRWSGTNKLCTAIALTLLPKSFQLLLNNDSSIKLRVLVCGASTRIHAGRVTQISLAPDEILGPVSGRKSPAITLTCKIEVQKA